jgi:anti-sigma B factor antagonist
MEVISTDEGKYHIIAINGDLDAASSITLDTALENAILQKKRHILIDCKRLNYISSPGIGVLTSRLEECEEKNMDIVLFEMNEKILNVFRILGLDQLLPIKNNLEDAKLYENGGVQH